MKKPDHIAHHTPLEDLPSSDVYQLAESPSPERVLEMIEECNQTNYGRLTVDPDAYLTPMTPLIHEVYWLGWVGRLGIVITVEAHTRRGRLVRCAYEAGHPGRRRAARQIVLEACMRDDKIAEIGDVLTAAYGPPQAK